MPPQKMSSADASISSTIAANPLPKPPMTAACDLSSLDLPVAPDVCPTTLLEVRMALGALGEDSGHVETLFISVDTEYDQPENLASYVSAFHPSITGLTGTEAQVAEAAKAFNVTYGRAASTDSKDTLDDIYHTAYVFLMDRDGSFVDVFGYGTGGERIARRVRELL